MSDTEETIPPSEGAALKKRKDIERLDRPVAQSGIFVQSVNKHEFIIISDNSGVVVTLAVAIG